MTLEPLAQIAVLEEAITKLGNVTKSISYVDTINNDIIYTIGLLEGMKKMLEHSLADTNLALQQKEPS